MKISKLFHWLYAFLMLLPVFFIGGRCLYVTFNKNAKDSYYGETINEEIKIFSSSIEDLKNNVRYNLQVFDGTNDTPATGGESNRLYIENVSGDGNYSYDDVSRVSFYFNNISTLTLAFRNANNDILFSLESTNPTLNSIQFDYVSYNPQALTFLNSILARDFIFTIEYNKYSYLDNAFIYSVNSLNDVPLFSWAKTSFLVAPFSYISGLFGIESTSPINTMLSYWLAISIIWLVFDLIMYVPLLVHRWIDKAKLE